MKKVSVTDKYTYDGKEMTERDIEMYKAGLSEGVEDGYEKGWDIGFDTGEKLTKAEMFTGFNLFAAFIWGAGIVIIITIFILNH